MTDGLQQQTTHAKSEGARLAGVPLPFDPETGANADGRDRDVPALADARWADELAFTPPADAALAPKPQQATKPQHAPKPAPTEADTPPAVDAPADTEPSPAQTDPAAAPFCAADELKTMCQEGLADFIEEREEVLDLLDQLIAAGSPEIGRSAGKYREELLGFEPSVTMIGQVKAGKTSLVNAMINAPGMLPADENPWTSVVTSLHLGPRAAKAAQRARFTFFEPEDWTRLTKKGGRVGELAGRTGAEQEAEKIRSQVEAMRQKTERRLGRRFELLLGSTHDYGSFDSSLIERYVCLGDDLMDGEEDDGQGRFADITKAADLWLAEPTWPVGLCLRDTPGVNDTFMMREQITIRAIRDSRLCVVVLSAHQALSSVDMALMRLIANVRAREVIVFVNRVDELSDPSSQIDEIRASIRDTLENHTELKDVPILFGSARWANFALTGALHELNNEAADTLLTHAEARLPDLQADDVGPFELIWRLSGLPDLYRAIWQRVAEGPAREKMQSVARNAMNLAIGVSAAAEADPIRAAALGASSLDLPLLAADLDTLEQQILAEFDTAFHTAFDAAAKRLDRSHRNFLDRATASLVRHLEVYGELSPWTYDPAGLRLLLRSGYQVFAKQLRTAGENAAEAAASGVAALYARALEQPPGSFNVQAPVPPRPAAPVLLGQTIALDLKGTWWRRWWSKRRGYAAFAPDFTAMIDAETQPILEGLRDGHLRPAGDATRDALRAFFDDQRMLLQRLGEETPDAPDAPDVNAAPNVDRLSEAVNRLGRLAA